MELARVNMRPTAPPNSGPRDLHVYIVIGGRGVGNWEGGVSCDFRWFLWWFFGTEGFDSKTVKSFTGRGGVRAQKMVFF